MTKRPRDEKSETAERSEGKSGRLPHLVDLMMNDRAHEGGMLSGTGDTGVSHRTLSEMRASSEGNKRDAGAFIAHISGNP